MKSIKFFMILLCGVLMSVCFISCGNNDDDENNDPYSGSPIIGSWSFEEQDGSDIVTSTYTFKADGTFIYTIIDSSDPSDVFTEKGTFKYDGNSTLTLVTTESDDKSDLGSEEINITISPNNYIIIHETKFSKK